MSTENIETASEVVDAAPKDATGTALAECDRVEQGLAVLAERFKGAVYDCRTVAGLQAAKDARLEIRETRFAVANAVEDAKKYLNETKRKIDQRGNEIVGRLKALEDPIDAQIKADEERRAAEKAKREAAERAARDALMQRLDAIRAVPLDLLLNASTEKIGAAILSVNAIVVADFGEFEPAAVRAINDTLKRLGDLHNAAAAREQADAERRAHEEKLAAERAELYRQATELKRQQDEAAAAERARKERAEAEERERERKAKAQEAERAAEQERIARAQREAFEAVQKREAETRAVAEREMAAARAQLHEASGLLLAALVSVQAWNVEVGVLPDWVEQQVNDALAAAGGPVALAATEEVL